MRQPYTLLALWFPIATTFRVMRIKRIIFKVFSIVYKEFVFLLFRLIRSATRGGEDQKASPAQKYAILYAIWYHLYNLKNGKTLLEVTLLHGRFSLFFKLHTWYQMAQSVSYFVKFAWFALIFW